MSWIKNERRYNDVIKFADRPQQSCCNMHFSLTTAFQRGFLNVILDLISSTMLVLLILSSFLNSSEHKQVSTRAEVFASRGVWRKSTPEKEETNAFLCKQVPLDVSNMLVYDVTSYMSKQKSEFTISEKVYCLPVIWYDLFPCGDDRNLGLNGLLHDVVELGLIGNDEVDGHIHLVISD